jgi:hypothetical protein
MRLRQAVDEFLLAAEADGLSPATVRWYKSLLGGFCDYIATGEVAGKYAVQRRERVADATPEASYIPDWLREQEGGRPAEKVVMSPIGDKPKPTRRGGTKRCAVCGKEIAGKGLTCSNACRQKKHRKRAKK